MNIITRNKTLTVCLFAILCGVGTFSLITESLIAKPLFAAIEYFEKNSEEDHIDHVKEVEPNMLVGSTSPSGAVLGASTSEGEPLTEYVLIAFDGSKSLTAWEDVLNFAQEMKGNGTPIHFSFFINAAYFLSGASKNEYISPKGLVAGSVIGFSNSATDISKRVIEVNRALREGHEIGSHTTGHNDGSHWTLAEWTHEFDSFNYILSNIEKLNPGVTLKEPLALNMNEIVGFRAPNLGVNDNMYKLLAGRHFLYDSSQIAKPYSFPFKDGAGLWHVPLGMAKAYSGSTILAMDYNWWVYQTGAKDILHKGTTAWEYRKNEVVDAYKGYFDSHYNGNRAPISIGHHFSLWNDGLYWEALKEFARYACAKKDVKCVSHKEYIETMEGKLAGI